MNVCVLAFSYPCLTETFVRKHVEGLGASVIAESINGELLNTAASHTHAIPLETPYIDNATSPMRRLKQFAVRHIVRAGRYVAPQKTSEDLRQHLINLAPDIVLVEFGHLAVAVLPVLRELKLPFVVHFLGVDLGACWKQSGYRRQLTELVKYASGVIVVNKRVQAARLTLCGCPEEKIHYIPCGADIATTQPRSCDANAHIRFLCVGRLVEKKGALYTLRAFHECNRRIPETSLTMIGDGPMMGRCKRYIRKSALTNQVRMLGALSHEEVSTHIKRASVFLQHSIVARNGDEEGWPVIIAEAQGAGLPVVSTRSGGIPENVLDGESGFLVAERDWKAMADCMLKLARNSELRHKMGEAGRYHISRNGDANEQLKKLSRVLKGYCVSV